MKRLFPLLVAAFFHILAPSPAVAQAAYPSKPVQLIVPTPAGGPSDAAARLIGQALAKSWASPSSSTTSPAPAVRWPRAN